MSVFVALLFTNILLLAYFCFDFFFYISCEFHMHLMGLGPLLSFRLGGGLKGGNIICLVADISREHTVPLKSVRLKVDFQFGFIFVYINILFRVLLKIVCACLPVCVCLCNANS